MSEVRRRCVFYVSGFDPKGAGHYHGLYKEQAALQARAGGLDIEVSPRKRMANNSNHYWTLRSNDGGVQVATHYEFMRWDDVVRDHWPKHQWQLWRDVVVTTLFYLRHGALWRMFKLSWPPAAAVFMPFMLLMTVLLGTPFLCVVAGRVMWQATGSVGLSAVCVLAAAALLVRVGLALEARYSMYWMMRSYAFTRLQALGRTPNLEARLDEHAERLVQRLRECADDEVLVVGHSSGAIMAAAIVARALRRAPSHATGDSPALSLLTLGQWIPLLGLLPQARAFRDELVVLAEASHLTWTDFSAPPDGCCFALADPIAGSGLQVPSRQRNRPKLLSPRFAEMFDLDAYRNMKRDKFRMHFQYLMASALPSEYDYFRITAGADTLRRRFMAVDSVEGYIALRPRIAR